MSTMDRQLTQRNGSLSDLVTPLREQHAAKLDVVIPAAGIRSAAGCWQIDGTGIAVLGPDGVTTRPGTFVPTDTCDAGMADKLGIPVSYLRRLRDEHLALYDANVNGWLEHQPGRRLLVRALRGDGGGGIARAVLSELRVPSGLGHHRGRSGDGRHRLRRFPLGDFGRKGMPTRHAWCERPP